ncbi:MAG: hypothetical protein JEZ11_21875 [Desulfobacterales bacterium]|nr:hypothetical protein [Desulfobacterales bacterium]
MRTGNAQSPPADKNGSNGFQGIFRLCTHASTGRIQAPKICIHNYECYHCQFDQILDDMDIHNQ